MDEAQRARAAAWALLQEYETAHPVDTTGGMVDVDAIAAYLGLDVAPFDPADQPETTYGWLEPGESLVWLRPALPEAVRRFTLAHELGHVRLHRRATGAVDREPCQADAFGTLEDDIADHLGGELLVAQAAYSPHSRREREANSFAAALLVPLDRLRARYLAGTTRPTALAEAFGVSGAVIERQLALLLGLTPQISAVEDGEIEPQRPPAETTKDTEEIKGEISASSAVKYAAAGPGLVVGLDEAQATAVRVTAPALVVAGPGAGKTATLVRRIQYLVESGVPAERILALTFSNKAAAEMRMRLEQVLGAQGTLPAVGTFHAFGAEVLRAYGPLVGLRPDFRLLDETDGYLLLQGLGAALPLDHYQHLAYPALYFPDLLRAIARAKDELVTPAEYLAAAEAMLRDATDDETRLAGLKAREVALVYATYQEALLARGDADFGDLIMRTVALLRDQAAIRAEVQQRYPHIVVDEFQDMNRASGRLLQLLAGDRRQVWVVGDSDQAIYRFRGASPANIRLFTMDYPGATVVPLRRNYRSTPDVVALANAGRAALAELSGVEAAPLLEATRRDDGPAVTLATAPTGEAELRGIAAAIARCTHGGQESCGQERGDPGPQGPGHGPHPPAPSPRRGEGEQEYRGQEPAPTGSGRGGDVSILASKGQGAADPPMQGPGRSWRYRDQVVLCRTREQARAVARVLQEAGIPVAAPAVSLLEYDIVKDLLSLLQLLSEPSGMGLLRATTLPGYEAPQADVAEVFRQAQERGEPAGILFWRREFDRSRLSGEGTRALDRLADLLDRLHNVADPRSMLLRYLFGESDWARRVLEGRVTPGDVAAVRALLAHASRYGANLPPPAPLPFEGRGEERSSPRGLLAYLRTLYQLRQDTVSAPEAGEDGPDVVRVMTIHASKGLEFPVVYVPNLAQGRFPAQNRGDTAPLPPSLGDGAIESHADTRQMEETCLFYVAVTRARDELVLSHAEQYGKRRYRPAEFIGIVERGLGVRVRREEWGDLTPQPIAGRSPLLRGEGERDRDLGPLGPEQRFDPGPQGPGRGQEPAPTGVREAISVSAVECYQRCPRQYQYSYAYHLHDAGGRYRFFHGAVSQALRTLEEQMQAARAGDGTLPDEAGAVALFTDAWGALAVESDPFDPFYIEEGMRVLARTWQWLAQPPEAGGTSRLAHQTTVEVDGWPVRLDIDRLERAEAPPGQPVKTRLVRHRLGSSRTAATPDTRTLLYALAHRQQAPSDPCELEVHNLSSGERQSLRLSARKEESLREQLRAALAGIARGEYQPRPEPRTCGSCPFLFVCPA